MCERHCGEYIDTKTELRGKFMQLRVALRGWELSLQEPLVWPQISFVVYCQGLVAIADIAVRLYGIKLKYVLVIL